MFIIAFDPGGSTGWKSLESFPNGEIEFREGCLGPHRHHVELWELLIDLAPNLVVAESFENRGNIAASLISRNYLGIIELYCAIEETQLVMQSAAEGKAFWNDDKLKRVTLWSSNKHTRDATRHLLHFISFSLGNDRWIRLLKPKE